MKIKYTKSAIAVAVASLTGINTAMAAEITWNDADIADSDWATAGNWAGGVAPADSIGTDIANIGNGHVSVSTTRLVNGIIFSGSGQIDDGGGTLEIGSGGATSTGNNDIYADVILNQSNTAFNVNGGRISMRTSSVISGSGGLDVTGTGTLYFDAGAGNTYTGGTSISGEGTISAKSTNSLGTGSLTLDNGTYTRNGASFAYDTATVVNAGGGQLNIDGNFTANAVLSGAGNLLVQGAGVERTWSAISNDYTGNITLDNSFFRTENNTAYGSGDIILMNNATIKNASGNRRTTLANDIVIDATGGAIEAGWNASSTQGVILDGTVSGEGDLHIKNDSGVVAFSNASTMEGDILINGYVRAKTGSLGTGTVTLDDAHGARGKLQNNGGGSTHTNDFIISDANNGGRLMAGWNANLEITGEVTGAGTLTVEGDSGTIVLSNTANTFTGDIVLQDATSRISVGSLASGGDYAGVISGADAASEFTITGEANLTGDSTFVGAVMVTTDGTTGGSGSLAGDLTLAAGAGFFFDETSTLTVAGDVSLDGSFGIDDLVGLSAATADGIYTLIDGTATDFASLGLDNWGEANAVNLDGDTIAYFQEGSLQLVVESIPEPSSTALLGLGGLALIMRRRK